MHSILYKQTTTHDSDTYYRYEKEPFRAQIISMQKDMHQLAAAIAETKESTIMEIIIADPAKVQVRNTNY